MNTYLIKIDIDSIKPNKDAGSTTTNICTNKTIKFECKILPNYFIDGENCLIYTYQEKKGKKINAEGIILTDELFNKCINELFSENINKRSNIKIEKHFNNQQINHAPNPRYSFIYENTKIICSECGEEIMTNDLKSEESCDGEYYSDKICPKCGEFDCCFLQYENINDAVKRAGL